MGDITLPQWAQIISALVVSFSFPILIWQAVNQNRIAKAQIFRHRFDMYWHTYDPISSEQVLDFEQNPEDYMSKETYEQDYKNQKDKIRRYIMLTMQFEYLAFLFALQKSGINDPLGPNWLPLWTTDLKSDPDFIKIKDYYRPYYPDYSNYVDGLL